MSMEFGPVQFILSKVEQVKRSGDAFTFRCPSHEDRKNSAWLKPDESGNAILKCFSGCSRKALCDALGIRESDLYVKQSSSRSSFNDRIVARYPYYEVSGKVLYEHLRLLNDDGSKTFLYRRSDGTGGFLWTLNSGWFEKKGRSWKKIEGANNPNEKPKDGARWFDASPRSLFHLSAVKNAVPGSLVLYCEGEKDVENAEALGFITTTAGGASDWRAQFADDLTGFDLIIIPDNDIAGQKCAAKVAGDCYGKASRVRVLQLPDLAKGGDLSDWMQAGGTREKLLELIGTAIEIESGTVLAIGGQNVHLSEISEIDISELQEIENDDLPISEDPKREWDLRQLAWNAAKVILACSNILRLLGFEKNHARIMNALISIGGARLSVLSAYQAAIRERYADSGSAVSEKTVQRDLKKLLEEQAALGVVMLSYKPGGKDFATDKSYPCRFQNHLLRYALEAINISLDTRDDFKTARLALEAACAKVVEDIPRVEPIETPTKQSKKSLTVEEIEARLCAMQEKLIELMLADGWTDEEIEAEIEFQHRRFYDRLKVKRNGKAATSNHQSEEVIQFL